ncbi:MAG: zf-HC2 domain-containing protein [Armatimonadota bacterium]|nr:zf-HC2 domain-containing protein [Armatimonadota bacterium]
MKDDHDRLRSLLPWLAAGTLDVGERLELEEHVRTCPSCAEEYRELLVLRSVLADVQSSFPPPPPEVLHRTWTRIVRHEASRTRTGLLRKAASSVLGLAAAVLVVLAWVHSRPSAFITLGSAPQHRERTVQVVFRPQATESEIRSLLHRVGATIDEGPRPSGLYRLRVLGGHDPEQVAELLRKHSLVVFAEVEP